MLTRLRSRRRYELMSTSTTNTDDTIGWITRAVAAMDGHPRLAAPDTLYFFRAARLASEEWTTNEMSRAWARLGPYRELLKVAGVRWRPAPTFRHEAVRTDDRLSIGCAGGVLVARFPYDHACTPAVRAIEGASWKKELRAWVLGATEAAIEAVEGLVRDEGFTVNEQGEAAMSEIRLRAVETRAESRAAAGKFTVPGFSGDLRPYQQAGVKYLVKAKRAFLADDMGIGKTRQALATVQALGAWPALVVTLASCKGGWSEECGRVLPGVRVEMWEGRGKDETRRRGDAEKKWRKHEELGSCAGNPSSSASLRLCVSNTLHVINYDLLSARLEELQGVGFKAVIFDECHHLRNGKSKRTAAAKVIVRRVPVRLGLSGTPILNCPQELLTQLHVLGRMKDVGGFWHFAKHYCAAKQAKHGWDFSGASNLTELHDRLRGICFLRRTKEQVLPELPPKISTRVPLGMTPDGWVKYHAASKDLLGYLGEKAASSPDFQKQLAGMAPEDAEWAKAQRIAEVIEKMDGMELLRRLGELLQVAAAGKLPLAKEWIREMCASRKLVLFAHHKAILRGTSVPCGPVGLLEEFREELGAVLIDGDTPSGKRQEMVRDFKTGKGRLFLVNLIAGGTGLDGLQHAASDVAFLERPWTPAGLEQAASRLHRIGQGGTVHEWHLLAPGTVDEELLALLAVKQEVCAGVNDGIEARKAGAFSAARRVAARVVNVRK